MRNVNISDIDFHVIHVRNPACPGRMSISKYCKIMNGQCFVLPLRPHTSHKLSFPASLFHQAEQIPCAFQVYPDAWGATHDTYDWFFANFIQVLQSLHALPIHI